MEDELLTDQQQAEQVKSWFRQNGFFLVAGVVLGLGGLFGWNQWNRYQERQAEEASSAYEALLVSVRASQLEQSEAAMTTLSAEFGSTPYADQARLAMAKLYMDQGKPDKAAEYLRQVVADAAAEELSHIARLRLARVLIFEEKYADALKVLVDPQAKAFAPLYHDVRGDVYYAMNKRAEARSEYEQALNGAVGSVIDRNYVQAKLDELGGASADLAGVSGAAKGDRQVDAAAGAVSTDGAAPSTP